jgi:hypothetical protein
MNFKTNPLIIGYFLPRFLRLNFAVDAEQVKMEKGEKLSNKNHIILHTYVFYAANPLTLRRNVNIKIFKFLSWN